MAYKEVIDKVQIQKEWYNRTVVANSIRTLFVFGDNCDRRGQAGQAQIRGLVNVIGLATKISPSMSPKSFFNDRNLENNKIIIDRDINSIIKFSIHYDTIIFPYDGLGTGLSKLPEVAPKTYAYLCARLFEEFDITTTDDGKFLIVKDQK